MKEKTIKNSTVDFIVVTDTPLSTKGITIKAVSGHQYTTSHLNLANTIELRDFLNEIIADLTPIDIDTTNHWDGMFTKDGKKLRRSDVKPLAELILKAD